MISTDNIKIYTLLETSGHLFSDFSADHVIAFDHDDDFCVIIYLSVQRNFIWFSAPDYLQQTNALPDLLTMLQEYPKENVPASLLDKGAKLVEDKMHSENNFRFYFDAH